MSKVKFTEIIKKEQDLRKLLDSETEYDFNLVHSVKKNIFKILREVQDVKRSLPEDDKESNEQRIKDLEVEINWIPIKKEYFPETIKPDELPISIVDLIE